MTTPIPVKVLLQLNPTFLPYEPGDQMVLAVTFDWHCGEDRPQPHRVGTLLEVIFRELNLDEHHWHWAVEYRRRGHRSLSVGDVVLVVEQAWAVEPVGWKQIRVAADQVWYDMGRLADG